MNVYFVRHGESSNNAAKVRQGADGALSKSGREQACFVAERFTRIPVDVIIASPFERAKETAEVINNKIKKPIEFSKYAQERRMPTVTVGKPSDDPDVHKIVKIMYEEGWKGGGPKHSDEESFDEFMGRVYALIENLDNRSEENIVVVSHGFFIRAFLAHILLREELTPHNLLDFIGRTTLRNTGITLFENTKEKGWRLIAWNDHAHLG